ncbi:MAG: hypothetical protein NXH75_06140, partial [Halobacteriovoraceae bacterium]|nr:hypothetical protein [Halobacteriovoraceae bacterium]
KITVDPDGEDYKSADFFSTKVINDKKIEVRDTLNYSSRLHLHVGYKGAPSPFDTRAFFKMTCFGDLKK